MAKTVFKITKTQDFVAIDLTGNYVKIAYARKQGGQTVFQDYRRQKFSGSSDVEIGQFLIQAYKEWDIKNKQAVCVIPSKLFISKNVDMPSNDPEEISKIIDLQAGRYTPYSRDEIVIDYLCMTSPGQHYTNVLLIIVNRKLVDRYVQIFERAGILLEKIAIASEGMAYQYRKLMPAADTGGAFAGIHIDMDSSDLVIVDKNEMAFVRNIPIGAGHFEKNYEEARFSFTSELSKSLSSYQDHGIGQGVKALLITGLTRGLESLEEGIREKIPLMQDPGYPIKIIPYLKLFQTAGNAGEKLDSSVHDSYFELMSSAAQEEDLKIDLMPKEIKLKRRFRESGKEIITFGILIMTCLVMICVSLGSKIYVKRNLIDRLDEAAMTVSTQARTLERVSTKSRVLRNLIEYRGKGLYVFDKVASMVGKNIYLASFSYDQEGRIHLQGTASTMSGVFSFVTTLENTGFFSSVVTNETKTRKEGGQDVADFDITGTLIEGI